MTFVPRRYEQILPDMIARVVTRTPLSDVADSSSYKQVLAASAREDDEQYHQMENVKDSFSIDTATGEDLDARAAEIQPATILRITARKAVGTVIFSRNGTTGTVNISVGTRVKTSDGAVYITTDAGTITPSSPEQIGGHGVGRDSAPVPIVAEIPGAAGNVVSGTIIKFGSKPAGVDEVTNLNPTTLGLDQESDDVFRQRIKDFVAALGCSTVLALESGVLGVEDVGGNQILYAKAVEDAIARGNVILYVDDGTGSVETVGTVVGENVTLGLVGPPPDSAVGGETELFLDNKPVKSLIPIALTSSIRGALVEDTDFTLNPANGQIIFNPALVVSEVITANYTHYTGLIQLAQKVVDGDTNDRINYPGIRSAGILVVVQPPQIQIQTIIATLTVREGFLQSEAIIAAEQVSLSYINSLGISGDVIRNEIIQRIQALDAIKDLSLAAPSANIILLDNQLARTTLANVNIT